jgi:hypothetical protein
MNITIPVVHLNGTSGDVLMEQLNAAAAALSFAHDALLQAAPNGRDFILATHAADASREHAARLAALAEIMAEIDEIRFGVDQQRP